METSRAINIVRKVSFTNSAVVSIINSDELFTSPRLVVPTHLVNLSRFQKESVKHVWNLFGKRDRAFIRFFDWFFGQYPEERKCLEKMHKFTEKVITRVETGLSEVLKDLDDREHLDSMLVILARSHQGRGVPRESFEIFIGAFCKFIADELDGDISEFDLEAWAITLRILMNSFGLYLC